MAEQVTDYEKIVTGERLAEDFSASARVARRISQLEAEFDTAIVGEAFIKMLRERRGEINRNVHERVAFDIFLDRANAEEELESLLAEERVLYDILQSYVGRIVEVRYRQQEAGKPRNITAPIDQFDSYNGVLKLLLGPRSQTMAFNGREIIDSLGDVRFFGVGDGQQLADVHFLTVEEQQQYTSPVIVYA